jgi:hypothetical protein
VVVGLLRPVAHLLEVAVGTASAVGLVVGLVGP